MYLNNLYPSGRTILHEVIAHGTQPTIGHPISRNIGSEMLAIELIQQGANIDARDTSGRTPLHLAAARGDEHTVRALLELGADCNARTAEGDSVLYVATYWQHTSVIRELIRKGADPNAANNKGKTPYMLALQTHAPPNVLRALATTRCCPKRCRWLSCLSIDCDKFNKKLRT